MRLAEEAPAPTALSDRVLVVFNRGDGGSREVAKYYAKMRGIPQQNLCSIAPIDPVILGWKEYLVQVKAPIQKCLTAVGRDNILYIVFSYQHAVHESLVLINGPSLRKLP